MGRFSQWYNQTTGRKGILWEARFKSVLVEDGTASRAIAAYIDLNPVRAGMVAAPALTRCLRRAGIASVRAGRMAQGGCGGPHKR
ncbi:MAG: hypothetical protein NTW21_18500 [Verrucomicrobia bacterium]|nr:hypothetical protein [Verrucomicrobiota bacterium]